VDVVAGPLALSAIEHLTALDLELEVERAAPSEPAAQGALDPVGVAIRLAPSLASPRHVTGALVPPAQGAWVKKLVYTLPQTTLRGHRVAVTDRGILLVAADEIDVVPLGQLMSELAPGLLVPLGMDLVPRVAPEVLARALGHNAGTLTVFPHDAPPFQVPESALIPLERRSLARIDVVRATPLDTRVEVGEEPRVVNDAVGRFSLWGFPAASASRRQLPAAASPASPPPDDEV
jgi:hypothetical protein